MTRLHKLGWAGVATRPGERHDLSNLPRRPPSLVGGALAGLSSWCARTARRVDQPGRWPGSLRARDPLSNSTCSNGRRGLAAELVELNLEAARECFVDMRSNAADPDDRSPTTNLVTEMLDDGIDLSDEAMVQEWIDRYSARPRRER